MALLVSRASFSLAFISAISLRDLKTFLSYTSVDTLLIPEFLFEFTGPFLYFTGVLEANLPL